MGQVNHSPRFCILMSQSPPLSVRHMTIVGDHSGSSAACALLVILLAYSLTSGLRQNHEGGRIPLVLLIFPLYALFFFHLEFPNQDQVYNFGGQVPNENAMSFIQKLLNNFKIVIAEL